MSDLRYFDISWELAAVNAGSASLESVNINVTTSSSVNNGSTHLMARPWLRNRTRTTLSSQCFRFVWKLFTPRVNRRGTLMAVSGGKRDCGGIWERPKRRQCWLAVGRVQEASDSDRLSVMWCGVLTVLNMSCPTENLKKIILHLPYDE